MKAGGSDTWGSGVKRKGAMMERRECRGEEGGGMEEEVRRRQMKKAKAERGKQGRMEECKEKAGGR